MRWVPVLLFAAACGGAPRAPLAAPPAPPPPIVRPPAPPPATRVAPLGADASPISFARMAKFPEPGWNVPRRIHLSPDDKIVTFLGSEKGDDEMAVMAFDRESRTIRVLLRAADLKATSRPRSREEELRRERQRQLVEGITSYSWAKRAPVMLVPHGGDLFLRDDKGAVTRLTDTPEPEIDPQICDTGEKVAFVRQGELVVLDVSKTGGSASPAGSPPTASAREIFATRGAPEGVTRGLSDFNAQEEFGQEHGFVWSPKCDRIAYFEVDERKVEATPVLGWRRGRTDLMMQKYPPPGGTNPAVRVGVLDLATKKTTWASFPDAAERYVVELRWDDDGRALYLEALPRSQKSRTLARLDPVSGKAITIVEESSPAWMDTTPYRITRDRDVVMTSDASGHRHLLMVTHDGSARQLTHGAWDVTQLVAVNEEKKKILFVGTKDGPLERHLYELDGRTGSIAKLTTERGSHRIVADERGRAWVDVHSALDRPPRAEIVVDGQRVGEIPIAPDPDLPSLGIRAPELVTVNGLHGALLKPRRVVPGGKHPAIVMVYGGPGAQLVVDAWMPRLMWQHLADRGFFVLQLDNRGSAGRGPAFEKEIYGRLGQLELDDQIAGASWLASLPEVDRARIGIYGHSYGGFLAALAMLKGQGRFAAGAAYAPVTDWALYDSAYSERYMGTPEANPAGFEAADLSRAAAGLSGPLLLVHGSMDENVHFANTAKLTDALARAGKPFDQIVIPGERHFSRDVAMRAYVDERIVSWLVDRLR